MSGVLLEVLCFAMGTGPLGCPWEGWLVTILIVALLVYMLIRARRREQAGIPDVSMGRFRVFEDARGEYRFNLVAPNREVILRSEGYTTRSSCKNGVEAVKRYATNAEIRDDTK